MNLNINTDGGSPLSDSSPRGWRYVLLHSPRNGGSSALPLLVLFFGVGLLLGGNINWYKPNTNMNSGDIQYQQHSNLSGSIHEQQEDHHVTPVGGRKRSLPLCWLMSFPVSKLVYLVHYI